MMDAGIHLHARDPLAWIAYRDWLADQDRDWEQPTIANSIGMSLRLIPAGTFLMGSPESEDGSADERPQHRVEISQPFYLGTFPVTQGQYQKVTGRNPSYFCSEIVGLNQVRGMDTRKFPVEQVSWEEAVAFCQALSERPEEKRNGCSYRLPSEAEWEYACRAGASSYSTFHFGNTLTSNQANLFESKLGRTSAVGSYQANAFGLYDMHGNVWEWCSDWYAERYYANSPRKDPQGPSSGPHRVLRGGGWVSAAGFCGSSGRLRGGPSFQYYYLGFRAAMTREWTPS